MTTRLISTTTEPVTVAEVKTACRIDNDAADTVLSGMIAAARSLAEQECGRSFALATWEKTLDEFLEEIELLYPPVLTIVQVSYRDADGATQVLDAADYVLDTTSEPGWLLPPIDEDWPETYPNALNAVIIRYTAGLGTSTPEAVKQWMYLQIRAWYDDPIVAATKAKSAPAYADGLLDRYRLWRP
jgi:uncharacterized phiE125 gp8 family phage protein